MASALLQLKNERRAFVEACALHPPASMLGDDGAHPPHGQGDDAAVGLYAPSSAVTVLRPPREAVAMSDGEEPNPFPVADGHRVISPMAGRTLIEVIGEEGNEATPPQAPVAGAGESDEDESMPKPFAANRHIGHVMLRPPGNHSDEEAVLHTQKQPPEQPRESPTDQRARPPAFPSAPLALRAAPQPAPAAVPVPSVSEVTVGTWNGGSGAARCGTTTTVQAAPGVLVLKRRPKLPAPPAAAGATDQGPGHRSELHTLLALPAPSRPLGPGVVTLQKQAPAPAPAPVRPDPPPVAAQAQVLDLRAVVAEGNMPRGAGGNATAGTGRLERPPLSPRMEAEPRGYRGDPSDYQPEIVDVYAADYDIDGSGDEAVDAEAIVAQPAAQRPGMGAYRAALEVPDLTVKPRSHAAPNDGTASMRSPRSGAGSSHQHEEVSEDTGAANATTTELPPRCGHCGLFSSRSSDRRARADGLDDFQCCCEVDPDTGEVRHRHRHRHREPGEGGGYADPTSSWSHHVVEAAVRRQAVSRVREQLRPASAEVQRFNAHAHQHHTQGRGGNKAPRRVSPGRDHSATRKAAGPPRGRSRSAQDRDKGETTKAKPRQPVRSAWKF